MRKMMSELKPNTADAQQFLGNALGWNMNFGTLKPLAIAEIMVQYVNSLETRQSPKEGSALECMLMSEDTLAKDWESELDPCPFCGGEANIEKGNHYWAVCPDCATRGSAYGNRDNAVKAWNTRQSPKAMTSEEYETAYLTGQGALREMVEGYFNKILGKRERDPKAMIAEATIREIAPFLRRLINPRYDTDETNDYVNGSSDCIRALEAIQVWDEICKQDKPKGGSDE